MTSTKTMTRRELEIIFKRCATLEDLKKCYFTLLKQYHPDVGGDTETTQHINDLYDIYFPILKNIRKNKDGETYTKETEETSNVYRDFLNKIIHLYGIKIEICGTWIWISGDTKPFKAIFRECGCKWSQNKMMWYFTTDTARKYYKNRKPWDINAIRDTFGSINIETDPAQQVG
jgi:curved DNA-binding protein CbpA